MRRFRLVFLGEINHQHPQRLAHLNGGKANARRVIHGVEHVAGKFAQLIVKALDRLGKLAQDGIGKDDERFNRHALHVIACARIVNCNLQNVLVLISSRRHESVKLAQWKTRIS